MDSHDIGRIVYNRIQSLDPENVSKIMGYLWLQDNADQEILHLAFSSDALLKAVVLEAKKDLGIVPPEPFHPSLQLPSYLSYHAQVPLHFSSPLSECMVQKESPSMGLLHSIYRGTHSQQDRPIFPQTITSQNLENHNCLNMNRPAAPYQLTQQEILSSSFENFPSCSEQVFCNEYQSNDRFGFLSHSSEHIHSDLCTFSTGGKHNVGSFNTRSNCKSVNNLSVSPESMSASSSRKPCLYYARGYCKHGSNCRFVHNSSGSDILSPFSNGHQRDTKSDGSLSPVTLERLELELQGLLRGRRGPVSIASLPQLYYETYGKVLQAEGYLTESQRHGKTGYSLTKLLARLKNTVTVIDRPHGQHAVVLADEAHKFLLYRGERDDLGEINSGSRQIYLTFPADSTFTEEDVSAYFRGCGPVQDVRIPYQQKRMFGFVTFLYPETVKIILAKGNPHYICGARVLVKPYKEKSKHSERKISERAEHSEVMPNLAYDGRVCHSATSSRLLDGHEVAMKRQSEEEERILELERQHFAGLQLIDMQLQHKIDAPTLPAAGHNGHGFNGRHQSDESARTLEELETQEKEDLDLESVHNLPDSPFTSPHNQVEAKDFSLAGESAKRFSLETQDFGLALSASVAFEGDTQYFCRICMGCFVDPIQLNCNHVFCVQCILKTIRVSKDECPICQQHIGSQILKLLENRGFQVMDIPFGRIMGPQVIW